MTATSASWGDSEAEVSGMGGSCCVGGRLLTQGRARQ